MIKCANKCLLEKFDGCCHCCPDFGFCKEECSEHPDSCGEATFDEESGIETFKASHLDILQDICNIVTIKKQAEAKEKELKDKLKKAMEQYGIKKFSSDVLDVVYVPDGTRSSLDGTKLKKLYPVIAEECTKVSKTSAYVKITVKGGEK